MVVTIVFSVFVSVIPGAGVVTTFTVVTRSVVVGLTHAFMIGFVNARLVLSDKSSAASLIKAVGSLKSTYRNASLPSGAGFSSTVFCSCVKIEEIKNKPS